MCATGSRSEFEKAFNRFGRDRALRIARRLTGNHHDAEDLVQETVIRAYKSFHTFKSDCSFESWFFIIMRNIFIDGIRKSRRPLSLEQIVEYWNETGISTFQMSSSDDTTLNKVIERMQGEAIRHAIKRLPNTYLQSMELYHFGNKNYAQIAAQLNIPVGTLKTRIHRGRTLLKEILRNSGVETFLKSP